MNHWMQTKQYVCQKCQATYLHDKAYHHSLFQCLKGERAVTAGRGVKQ